MPLNFFKRKQQTTIVEDRKNYVKEYAYNSDVNNKPKLMPCEKFVGAFEKLSHNYVLCLSDPDSQVKTSCVSVLQFCEGYDVKPEVTDNLRETAVDLTKSAYFLTISLVHFLSVLEQFATDKKNINEIKMDVRVVSDVVLNVYKHLSMLNEIPQFDDGGLEYPNSYIGAVQAVTDVLAKLIDTLIRLNEIIEIDYINKQLENIILKLQSYLIVIQQKNKPM